MDGIAKRVKALSALVAEAFAVRIACEIANIRGLSELAIFSDSRTVIYLASSDLDPPWIIAAIINVRKWV